MGCKAKKPSPHFPLCGENGDSSFFDKYYTKFPNQVIGFSEYGADTNPQFQSADPEHGDYSEETLLCGNTGINL